MRVTMVSFHTSRFEDAPMAVWRSMSSSVLHATADAYGITMEVETVEVRLQDARDGDCIGTMQ